MIVVTNRTGEMRYRTNTAYVELATGLNRFDAQRGTYEPADPAFTITPEGYALAEGTQHKVCISPLLTDAEGAVRLTTPDGKTLSVTPSALVLADRASGATVLIGEITNSVGVLVAPNVVLFTNVLGPDGIQASIRMVNEIGAFHSDVVLSERLDVDLLRRAGFDPATSEIEIWSAFIGGEEPKIEQRVVQREEDPTLRAQMREPDVINDDLDWGAFKMPMGRAYLFDGERDVNESVQVSKRWTEVNGQRYIVEKIPLGELEPLFGQLAPQTRPLDLEGQQPVYANDWHPRPLLQRRQSETILLADSGDAAAGSPELVLDWTAINGNLTNYTFQGDTTYSVVGPVNLYDTTTLEGGTVLKFTNGTTASLTFHGPLNCQTGPYRPAIFTAKDDDTVGETISGSTGDPEAGGVYGNKALTYACSGSPLEAHDLQIRYKAYGIETSVSGNHTIKNCQLYRVDRSLYGGYLAINNVRNVLIEKTDYAFMGYYTTFNGEHVTVHDARWLGSFYGNGLNLTNSLLVGVTNWVSGALFSSVNNATNATGAGVFQTVGAGAHYLAANSPYRNAGTTSISPSLLDDLSHKTTYPPSVQSNITISADTTWAPTAQRDTDTPDLGYHYDPIDYAVTAVSITNASLTLTNGAALAMFGTEGVVLRKDGRFISEGGPTDLNHLVHYRAVQEQPVNWGPTSYYSTLIDLAGPASGNGTEIQLRFTDVSRMAGTTSDRWLLQDHAYATTMAVTDCEWHGVYMEINSCYSPGTSYAFTNNLFRRCDLTFDQTSGGEFSLTFYSNLFYQGWLRFSDWDNSGGWYVQDNLFDCYGLDFDGTAAVASHNAFVSGLSGYVFGAANITGLVPDYQKGALGDFYYPTTGTNLARLINAGSTTSDLLGLYHYTSTTNQVKETNSPVDIGYHYVAVNTNSEPVDTDQDGLADYVEDANGNGTVDPGETSPTDMDTDGDGLTDLGEITTFGSDPTDAHTFDSVGDDAEYLFATQFRASSGELSGAKTLLGIADFGYISPGLLGFAIFYGDPGATYDLYFVNNLALPRWHWRRVYTGIQCDSAGEAYWVLQEPEFLQGYFIALSANDRDGDGLTDGYEAWFKYNGQHTLLDFRDSEHEPDGLPDGWEVAYGLDPTVGTPTGTDRDSANGNPDEDYENGFPLTNTREYEFGYSPDYDLEPGSYDPLKPYGTSSDRPVVTITGDCSPKDPSFTISRAAGDYSQPLVVYYAAGGNLSYDNGDYNLDPVPDPLDWPRIYSVEIPAANPGEGIDGKSVTLTVKDVTILTDSGKANRVAVSLTPYGVAVDPQVSADDAASWEYVVDWHKNRASVYPMPDTQTGALITGMSVYGEIHTFDFDTGGAVVHNSFPSSGGGQRGLAIRGNETFYTLGFPVDTIHVAPYSNDGNPGTGGPDTRIIANPRPSAGIQDLAFHYDPDPPAPYPPKTYLYVLTGYHTEQPLVVFEVDPDSANGEVTVVGPSEGITISGPHGPSPDCDGFTVLPNGNFFINDGDGADMPFTELTPTYREYDASTGNLVPGGLTIDLSALEPECFEAATGVALAPDGQSLYFMVNFDTLIQTDLEGKLLGAHQLDIVSFYGFEDIDVVVP